MFGWLFNKPNYRRFEDSYALNRSSLMNGLRESIDWKVGPDQITFLVAHFPDVFSNLQLALEDWKTPYEVVVQTINRQWLEQIQTGVDLPVFLTMAELFETDMPANEPWQNTPEISIMVAERHPLETHDRCIEDFGRQLRRPVALGYFLALDDEIIKQFISPGMIHLLRQLGLREQELVTSHMVTRKLNQATRKMNKQIIQEQPADSAADWFQLNVAS